MAYIKMQFKSAALMRAVTVRVLLPTDAVCGEETEPPYRTVYFLPGYSADSTELITYLGLRRECELKGVAVIVVDGCNSFYVDHPERNECFSVFIGKEVVEFTRKLFPLSARREDTWLAGISMGGYGALYNGLKFWEIFSKIAALSPSTDCYDLLCGHPEGGFQTKNFENIFGSKESYDADGMNLELTYAKAQAEKLPQIFLACGRQDTLVVNAVDHFAETLCRAKIPYVYRVEDGKHDLDFWERMLDPTFSFLTGIEEGTKARMVLGGPIDAIKEQENCLG